MVRFALFFIAIAMLAGCAGEKTVVKPTPEAMATKGLVAFRFDNERSFIGTASFVVEHAGKTDTVYPDGEFNYPILVLAPGHYVLKGMSIKSVASITTYPMEREFDVKPGRLTSLGIAYFSFKPQTNLFHVYWVGDESDTGRSLRGQYPDLLKGRKLELAPGPYINDKQLEALRKSIVARKVPLMRGSEGYVFGDLGSLVYFRLKANKKLDVLRVVDTGTKENIYSCALNRKGVACVLPRDSQLLIFDGSRAKRYPFPHNFDVSSLGTRDGDRMLALNGHFGMAFSGDGGRSWKTSMQYARNDDNLDHVERGAHGLYVFSTEEDGTLLYIPDGSDKVEKIDTGIAAGNFRHVVELNNGLYLGPESTMLSDSHVYYRPNKGKEWTAYTLPGNLCTGLAVTRDGKLKADCSNGSYVSSDGAKSWVWVAAK